MATMLSTHISLDDVIRSGCGSHLGVSNMPCGAAKNNLVKLCTTLVEPILNKAEKDSSIGNKKIKVNSTYRSKAVNDALGQAQYRNTPCWNSGNKASRTSQHMRGEAIDLSYGDKTSNKALFDLIEKMVKAKEITIGQLINEEDYKWVHVSLGTSNQKLRYLNHKRVGDIVNILDS